MTERPCRFCGAKIAFAAAPSGRGEIPLQRVRSVYTIDAGEAAVKIDVPEDSLWVSHWETCSRVEQAKAAQERKKQRDQRKPESRRRA